MKSFFTKAVVLLFLLVVAATANNPSLRAKPSTLHDNATTRKKKAPHRSRSLDLHHNNKHEPPKPPHRDLHNKVSDKQPKKKPPTRQLQTLPPVTEPPFPETAMPIFVHPDLCCAATALDLNETAEGTFDSREGVWFSVVGTGGFLSATTCTGDSTLNSSKFDTALNIYSGSCDSLNVEPCDHSSCKNLKPMATFGTVDGATYYVNVAPFHFSPENAGSFDLTVTEFDTPPNTLCETGTPAQINEVVQVKVSTLYSSWYTVNGTDGFLVVTLCADDSSQSSEASINVYSGSCDNLISESYTSSYNDSCQLGYFESSAMYYLSAGGYFYYSSTGSTYALKVDEVTEVPNTVCLGAIPLQLDKVVQVEIPNDESIWYAVSGTGGYLAVSTCTDNISWDSETYADVYSGRCVDLIHETAALGTHDYCEIGYFEASLNETYYLKAHGYNSDGSTSNSFDLKVYEVTEIPNSDCLGASPLELDEVVQVETPNYGSIWYTVSGTGGYLAVSTCTDNISWDSKNYAYVYSGSCDNLSYETKASGLEGLCEIGYFEASSNETYYLEAYVPNNDDSTNNTVTFDLKVFEVTEIPNSDCLGATPLELDKVVQIEITNLGSFWYAVSGTAGYLAVSTCIDDISWKGEQYAVVYSGSCDNLIYETSADNFIYKTSAYGFLGCPKGYFEASANETYYLEVYGSNYDNFTVGTFDLKVYEETELPNSICLGAAPLELDEIVQVIENTGSFWYTVSGTGGYLAVSTCTDDISWKGYQFVDVYSGSCDNLIYEVDAYDWESGCGIDYFEASVNETYYLEVNGNNFDESAGNTFDLKVYEVTEIPTNICHGARNLLNV